MTALIFAAAPAVPGKPCLYEPGSFRRKGWPTDETNDTGRKNRTDEPVCGLNHIDESRPA